MNSEVFHFSRNPITFWFVSLPSYMWQIISGQTGRLYHIFSIPELARTLFAPWKRDEVSTANLALSDKIHIWTGNLATRFVAVFIRSATIGIGLGSIGLFFTIGSLLIVMQMFLPLVMILLVVLGWGVYGN